MRIRLPNNWTPRPYQMDAWAYLENGGRHAELIWHRRSGKDDIALHRSACAAFERVGNYWHMLPEYAQARKAIWEAVNPHTGRQRIDEAFPMEIREVTRNDEMFIRFKNGSTWQVVGSDSYNRLVGSTPIGVVYSEWAITNPAARAYLRPIFKENNGWQIFITTPRGHNHAYKSFYSARATPGTFTQILTAADTRILTRDQLEEERRAYIGENGEDEGEAIFQQEYFCSWDAAILGAYYGKEMRKADEQGRIGPVQWDEHLKVYTAWDLGYKDDTAIWFYQVLRGEVRVIDFYSVSGASIEQIADAVKVKPYRYAKHYLPHDARAKTLAAAGKSIIEQLASHLGFANLAVVPELSVQDGIQAVRQVLPRCWFNEDGCRDGIEALRQYQREYDEDKKAFRQTPRHDWASHPADAFRMLALAYREDAPTTERPAEPRPLMVGPTNTATLNDMWATAQTSRRTRI